MSGEQESRQHAIERMCHLQALVGEQVHHWQHAADCFCGSLSDEWYERNYRNDEEAIQFIEDAVVAAVSVAVGRSEDTIRSILGRLETRTVHNDPTTGLLCKSAGSLIPDPDSRGAA